MIHVSVVDAIPAGAAGKRPLVVALPKSHNGAAVRPALRTHSDTAPQGRQSRMPAHAPARRGR